MSAKATLVDADIKKIDQAALFLAEAEDYVPLTPKQQKRLKRKIDFIVVPMVIFYCFLALFDVGLTSFSSFLQQPSEPLTKWHSARLPFMDCEKTTNL